eukprot:jgi/Picre1/35551/NNA_003012.t1
MARVGPLPPENHAHVGAAQNARIVKKKNLIGKKFSELKWTTPHMMLPHGISGLGSCLLGILLTLTTLVTGRKEPRVLLTTHVDNDSERHSSLDIVQIYLILTLCNSLSAFFVLNKAPKSNGSRTLFRISAIFQTCLVYFAWRFFDAESLPTNYNRMLSYIYQLVPHGQPTEFTVLLSGIPTMVDRGMACLMVATLFSFGLAIWRNRMIDTGIKIGCLCGVGALTLLSGYPLQYAFGSSMDWWNRVLDNYPLQANALVYFVYIPACCVVSIIMFAATLYNRKILGTTSFALLVFCSVFGILLTTVLSQELYIPCISTQKLLIDVEGHGRVFGIPTAILIRAKLPKECGQRYFLQLISNSMIATTQ